MAKEKKQTNEEPREAEVQLEQGTYEVIQNRLRQQGQELRKRIENLNADRKEVFGAIETRLITSERITTENNCFARDMTPVGPHFIFGYNVHMGLKSETQVSDVFSVYKYENHQFIPQPLDLLSDEQFVFDFKNLYKYYKDCEFIKFGKIGPHLYMKFRVGKNVDDVKAFKWLIKGDVLEYVDNRSEHEFRYPDQHEFKWKRTTRDYHREGKYPHISIEDRLFVETIGGDLTIKIEDNTDTGQGIYAEPVEEVDQNLDDAEITYALVGNIIVLKVKPYNEQQYRYIVYNEKVQEALRIDALEGSCVLLPDDHGIIFARGYYLQTGEFKLFEIDLPNMLFEKRIPSPNGEDYLYVFYNRQTGVYLLLQYNLIEQRVETPIICNGFCIFDNGEMCFFREEDEQRKHHAIQIWQTPFVHPNYEIPATKESKLYNIGNKDIVRAMAECHEILTLIQKGDTYVNLYVDLVRNSTDVLDSFHWLHEKEAYKLSEPLINIQQSSKSAIDEYEKVVRIKKNTYSEVKNVTDRVKELVASIKRTVPNDINQFVQFLAKLRELRGDVISLKDLRYVEMEKVEAFEKELEDHNQKLSEETVRFLLRKNALAPYEQKVAELEESIETVKKVADANAIAEQIEQTSKELEMLIEIVSNLKIEDATKTTQIIDNISAIYSTFNQIRAALKRKRKEMASVEGKAEFNAQLKLIDQSVINYLDVSDNPDKCDQYLNKLMVQMEELEGKFAEFDEFITTLADKREEVYNAFETKKIQLVEARNKRATSLQQSADRILKGIQNKANSFNDVTEINGYFAADLMVDKVRDIIKQLTAMGDSVKADDIQSRLKTIKEDTIRQLKDKKELFAGGSDLIKFGNHQFSVNTQPLDLSIVYKDNEMFYHLTGTNFFEKIKDPEFLATRDVWEQSLVSENDQVYRGEFLAYQLLQEFNSQLDQLSKKARKELFELVKQFMAPRYNEGYVKGIHDHDATIIWEALIQLTRTADLLRYPSTARACAALYWQNFAEKSVKETYNHRLKGVGTLLQVFPDTKEFKGLITELQSEMAAFVEATPLFSTDIAEDAGEYLFYELIRGDRFVIDVETADLFNKFNQHLKRQKQTGAYEQSIAALNSNVSARFKLIKKWLQAFVEYAELYDKMEYIDEAAVILLNDNFDQDAVVLTTLKTTLEGLQGAHPLIEKGEYHLNYNAFMIKLKHFIKHVIPKFKAFAALKKQLTEDFREELRLNEFKPRVLTSFVRNQLIDKVYLPIIGDNLSKQIGAAGDNKRTDRMGMLLLISPPGYGKTTLMEYIANRLGVVFMKINGPAIGNKVTSLDPKEAPNSNAREELEKLNLSFEMGDNVMIYLDDIQHCDPEFLQKFISLCDAQRKIEGTYKGKSKTYDLRGKKVCVVMAGNPYTESGEKFKIPDMLANRADIYNLGDILGDSERVFKLSYIENSLTSNPVLRNLASKSHKDLYPLIQLAETGDKSDLEFEASHSTEDLNEYVNVLKKLFKVRDTILRVNMEYIRSAGQSDEFRTEPAFKLQGSYRDMNKIAEKILPVINEGELTTLINSHYENEAQTLTTGAEANLLKFKEITGQMNEAEKARWEAIKQTYRKNKKFKGIGEDNPFGQVAAQMDSISEGLQGIAKAIGNGSGNEAKPKAEGKKKEEEED